MIKRSPAALFLFFLLLTVLLAPRDAAAVGPSPRNVLLLTSYHQGDRWNDSVVQGVRETLGSFESVSLSIENLDRRRYTDQEHIQRTTAYIRSKYQGKPQDLILVADDPALNFLLTVREDLFPKAPVVFCGVNNFTAKRIQGQTNITGINEELSLETTLELALKLFPKTTRILAVVSDTEGNGRTNLEQYRAVATRMKGRVQFDELLNMTSENAPDILSRLPKDTLLLRLINLLKPEGGYLSIQDSIQIISAHAPVPVFTPWSFDLGGGALGGHVSSGQDQGRAAGTLAIRLLKGEEVDQIPVIMDSPNVPMFDYKVMERFGIEQSALPEGSVILNRQVSMWEQYWGWIFAIALFCGVQALLILALLTRGKRLGVANAALRESELRFKALHNASFGGITIHDKGLILDCNQGLSDITGYSYEELVGMDGLLLIAEQSRERVKANILAGYEKPYEAYGLRKNGEVYPLRLEARNIPFQGRDVRVVEFRDITEHKRAEVALRESEERFRMLASESPVSIVAFDHEGRVTFVSDWHLTRFAQGQLGAEFFLGRRVWELPSLVSSGEADRVRRILAGENLHADEVHVPSNSIGKEAYQNMRGVPFRRDGAIVGGVLIREDITERKRSEEERSILNAQLQQAQKMEAIGTLAGGIAHDFNNILGAIIGYSEIIRDDLPPGSPGIHDIEQVLKASHRAKDLVKQILAFSRQTENEKIPMQPAGIVKETIALLRSSLPATVTIKQEIDPDAGMVLANPTQMHQIVMNLCTNAFHAMEGRGGTLTISLQKKILGQDDLATEPDLQPGTFVQLSIRDTGEGMLPEIRNRIFDPFFTTKEVGKGTGLGLSMVYSIVKNSGGSITCDSRVGEGTEFRILLPTLEGQSVEENESTDLIAYGKGHILFIDDEEMLVELGQAMLEHLGYQVTALTSSLEALTTFQNDPLRFDAVITDQTMPGMTGLDLAWRMLQVRPELPIILCTGYSKLVDEAEAKAYGIKGFAMKPLTQKEIAALLREVLTEAARTTS